MSSLTEEDKKRLEEEEAYRRKIREEEEYRLEVTKRHDKKASKKSGWSKWWLWIFIFLLIPTAVAGMSGNQSEQPKQTQETSKISVVTPASIPYEVKSNGSVSYIIVDPKNANAKYLSDLGEQLQRDYASSSVAMISIYDNARAVEIRRSVTNGEATQADNEFYDAHYVGQYNKNANTGYERFTLFPMKEK